MDNTFVVRSVERLRNLTRNRERRVERHRPARDSSGEIFALDKFHHQEVAAGRLFQSKQRRDVRVMDRGQQLRLALEARRSIAIAREAVRKDLQRDKPPEFGVSGFVDLAHPPGAERRQDLIDTERCA
jgi:hypothetical protein